MIIQKENSSNVLFKKFFFKYDATQGELIIIFQVGFFYQDDNDYPCFGGRFNSNRSYLES